jgi:hypothetical protein
MTPDPPVTMPHGNNRAILINYSISVEAFVQLPHHLVALFFMDSKARLLVQPYYPAAVVIIALSSIGEHVVHGLPVNTTLLHSIFSVPGQVHSYSPVAYRALKPDYQPLLA